MSSFDLIYHCDSYPEIGNGHLKRGIDILNEIQSQSPELYLGIKGNLSQNAKLFLSKQLSTKINVLSENENYCSKVSVIDKMFIPENPDYVDNEICSKIKNYSNKSVLIHSGLNLEVPNSIDAVIGHLQSAKINNKNKCKTFMGFDFAPVSSEFKRERVLDPGNRIVCVLGGSKYEKSIVGFIDFLNNYKLIKYEIDIILSPHYEKSFVNEIKDISGSRLIVHQNVKSLIPYFINAKIVFTTYGNSTYESLTFFKPTFVMAYVKFQYDYAEFLEKEHLVVNLGYINNLDKIKFDQVMDESIHYKLARKAKLHFKNSGIDNISKIILEYLNEIN